MGLENLELGRVGEDGACTVWATVGGWPAWRIEAEVRVTGAGPVLSQLQVYPRQDPEWRRERTGSPTLPSDPSMRDITDLAQRSRWSSETMDVPPGGIPSRLFRGINVGELLDFVQAEAKKRSTDYSRMAASQSFDASFRDYLRAQSRTDRALTAKRQRPGVRGHGIDHYLLWAVRYIEAGKDRPVAKLAKRHKVTERWVRDTITDARRRHGLLTSHGQGKAGGDLTQKALDLLAERQGKGASDG